MTHETETTEQLETNGGADTAVAHCLSIIDQYRGGTVSKGDAIYEFTKTIPVEETETEESPAKTLESYVAILDDWDRERTLSDADEQREGAQNEPRTDVDKQPRKRGERFEEDECDEPIHRRPKIDPGQFPWSVTNTIEGCALRDECAATRGLIANYTLDIKLAKAHLLNSGVAPKFPDTEWKSVLLGLAVNLDAVFSGRYSTEHDSKITHDIGDFTISTQEAAISKAVKSAGDWFIAWNQAAAATVFAFPHRLKECQDYRRHILNLFAAFAQEHHHLILNYD